MIAAFRLVFGLLLFAGVVCFAAYAYSGDIRWRHRGVVIVKWTLVAALGFFAVLIAERLSGMV